MHSTSNSILSLLSVAASFLALLAAPAMAVPSTRCTSKDTTKCLYRPAAHYAVSNPLVITDVMYTDALGQSRTVPIAVYRPSNAPLPAPVVLLSHGGSDGKTDPTRSMDQWARAVARAGYVAVAIAHAGRGGPGGADYTALCTHLEVPNPCAIKIHWDRPLDVRAVLDRLELESARPGSRWHGVLDLTRVAHVGHSAGGGSSQMLGGVPRNFICAQPFGGTQGTPVACELDDFVSMRDARIDAVIATSPTGPDTEGFDAAAFAELAVPLLMASGTNDGDPGEPENRLAAWEHYPAGERWKLYIDDLGAQHTLFLGETDACEQAGVSAARCVELRNWLLSTGIAFLDAELRSDARARQWLGSGRLGIASDGAATLVGK